MKLDNVDRDNNSYEDYMRLIGEKFYTARHLRREKISTVAKANNISSAVISQIENGRYKSLSMHLLIQLAGYYDIHPSEIIASAK